MFCWSLFLRPLSYRHSNPTGDLIGIQPGALRAMRKRPGFMEKLTQNALEPVSHMFKSDRTPIGMFPVGEFDFVDPGVLLSRLEAHRVFYEYATAPGIFFLEAVALWLWKTENVPLAACVYRIFMQARTSKLEIRILRTNTSSLQDQPNPLLWVDNTGQVWIDNIVFSGNMHIGEMRVLEEELGPRWMSRMVNVPMLAIEYVSDKDLEWWFREKMLTLNVTTWNHPRIFVTMSASFPGWTGSDDLIQGDLPHIDMGITAMGMNTDAQHLACVLHTSKGETDALEGLKAGLKKGNRMQDIVLENMKAGLTGDEILQRCLEQMKLEDIEGFTNFPEHVPVLGEPPLLPNTYYSIELFATHFVPERNETLSFLLEENAYWNAEPETWQFVRGTVYIEKGFSKAY
ncbi:hypothetical protein DFS33DRAFT_1273040 [Desarmillaria ectypa]|nr:hypothetical protein DFS33DRAFT_1273040 [Desarmillaria ectypa]